MTVSAEMVAQLVAEIRLPALALYGGDWLRDPVSGCSLAAQALWFRLMLIMHDAKPYGHLVGANGEPLGEKQLVRQIGCSGSELRKLRVELEAVGVPGRTGDVKYEPIFTGDINGEEIDLSPLRISLDNVIYCRRMVKDQRLRIIRRLTTILGKPKAGRLTGQNADTRAGGRPDHDNDSNPEGLLQKPGEGAGEGRPLTPPQLAVNQVEDALYAHTTGFALPDPGRIAKWISIFGIDLILTTIREEGDKGSLDNHNGSYLHQCIESRKRRRHATTGTGNRGSSDRVHAGAESGGSGVGSVASGTTKRAAPISYAKAK